MHRQQLSPRPLSSAPADDGWRIPLSRRPLLIRLDFQQECGGGHDSDEEPAGQRVSLFTLPMFYKMGINWASSFLGVREISVFTPSILQLQMLTPKLPVFVAGALMPIPYLFYVYVFRIRARGEWSRPSTE